MPSRRPLLDHLARALLWGAVAAPLLLLLAQAVPGRADIRWSVSVPWFGPPQIGTTATERTYGPWGSALALANTGTGDSEPVRIVLGAELPRAPTLPSVVEVRGRDLDEYELVPTETGGIVELGPLEPGERLEVTMYHVTWMDVEEVLHGDEPVPMTEPAPRFDPRLPVPRWAALGVLLLLAGLAVQVLALRSRAARIRVA
jgi:hypothetical protein